MKKIELTRRDFVKSMGLGALGMMLPKAKPAEAALFGWGPETRLGRILRFKLQVKKEPNHLADSLDMLVYDEVLPIRKLVHTTDILGKKIGWYEIGDGQYLEAAWVQPVYNRPSPINNDPMPESGCLGEICVPIVPVYHEPNRRNIHRTFYYDNNFWILNQVKDEYGVPWYELWDDLNGLSYFVKSMYVRRTKIEEVSPINPEVPPDQKRLVLELGPQVVRAYEYNKPVWEAQVSSGLIDGSTPVGRWMTHRKRPCRRMVNEPGSTNIYDLPGVPWVTYITINGVAFHGAYWHANWGHVMSNGCINMRSEEAKWLYRWSDPHVPFDKYFYTEPVGTRVDVVTGFGDTPST